MNQEELRTYLNRLVTSLRDEDSALLRARLHSLVSAFPFNEYEYMITFLVDREVLSFEEYEKLRENYVSSNRYLHLFSLAPRVFGQIWGEKHLMDLDPRIEKPDKTLDPNYEGQYDLLLDGVRVEVKAARAIHTKKRGAVPSKALRWGTDDPIWMNYQQLKLDICEVFVFIGVWVDKLVYWVLSNREAKENPYLRHQHRGGTEYQIGITHKNISEFDEYRVEAADVAATVLEKGGRSPA